MYLQKPPKSNTCLTLEKTTVMLKGVLSSPQGPLFNPVLKTCKHLSFQMTALKEVDCRGEETLGSDELCKNLNRSLWMPLS